jgi:hypothetical protein
MFALAFLTPFAALYVHYAVLTVYGAERAGWMQAAVGVSLAVRTLLQAPHTAFLLPNVSRGGSAAERMRWAGEYQRTLGFLVALLGPPILLFPDLAVRALYSAAFLPGARFVGLFVGAEIVTMFLGGVYQAVMVALDHTFALVLQNGAAQLILLGVATALLRPLGIGAAAVGNLVAQLFLFGATMLFLRRRYGARMSARNYALAAFVIASLAASGVLGVARTGYALGTLLIKGAAYVAFVGLLAMFLTPADWANLRRLVEALRGRGRAAVPATPP